MQQTASLGGSSVGSLLMERAGWLALAIVAMGFGLRLPGLLGWWLNPDEGIYYSMLTWTEAARFWQEMAANAHPPLFYVILRGLGHLTRDVVWLRSFSLICGCLAIFAAWLAGRELDDRRSVRILTGLLSALLIALSPGAITLSQVMRPYMLQLLFLLLALWLLLRYRRERRAGPLAGYSISLSIALLTHYGSVFALAAFSLLLFGEWWLRRLGWRELGRLAAAHVLPGAIVLAFFWLHVRRHLIASDLAAHAFGTWLVPYMIHSTGDVWRSLLGVHWLLVGPWLAAPAALLFLAGLVVGIVRRRWAMLTLSSAAVLVAVVGAATGKYPFGACRHSVWMFAVLVPSLAWALAVLLTSGRRATTLALPVLVVLCLAGPAVGRWLGAATVQGPIEEQVLKWTDLAEMVPLFSTLSTPGVVLMSHQSYYLLMPFYTDERELAQYSTDGSFFHFRWGARDVLVAETWEFSVLPTEIGQPKHLYTFVQTVDRERPEIGLGQQRRALMFFGGWSYTTPVLLDTAYSRILPAEELIKRRAGGRGFYAVEIDIEAFRRATVKLIEQRGG